MHLNGGSWARPWQFNKSIMDIRSSCRQLNDNKIILKTENLQYNNQSGLYTFKILWHKPFLGGWATCTKLPSFLSTHFRKEKWKKLKYVWRILEYTWSNSPAGLASSRFNITCCTLISLCVLCHGPMWPDRFDWINLAANWWISRCDCRTAYI